MSTAIQPKESVEQRLAELEKQFAELRAEVLRLKPRVKDWRRTVGMMPRDEMTLEAERLGREWREQANKE